MEEIKLFSSVTIVEDDEGFCALRFMGFVPDDRGCTPPEAVVFVSQQLAVEPDLLAVYGARAHTRQDHLHTVQAHLGYRKSREKDLKALADWLLERALEHDKPTLPIPSSDTTTYEIRIFQDLVAVGERDLCLTPLIMQVVIQHT